MLSLNLSAYTSNQKRSKMESNCGTCAFFITDDGESYYCAIRDLYTFVKASDKACPDYQPNTKHLKNNRSSP